MTPMNDNNEFLQKCIRDYTINCIFFWDIGKKIKT